MEKFTNVIFADNRVFIDVADGCGNACIYCYSEKSAQKQQVIELKVLGSAIDYIIGNSNFVKGKNGTIVSMCPHTEPFKSKESTQAILLVLDKILPYKNRIQIATKEIIPDEFLSKVVAADLDSGQVCFFISVSSILNYERYEPFAAPLSNRLQNIHKLKITKINTCLYVKPFLINNIDEINHLFQIIDSYEPDAICVGIEYQRNNDKLFVHPTNPDIYSPGITGNMDRFLSTYRKSIPLFLTSSCVIAYLNQMFNFVTIPEELCIICNMKCGVKGKWKN